MAMRKAFKQELQKLSVAELAAYANEIRKEIFTIKMKKMSEPVKDVNLLRKLRKSLACTLTFLQQGIAHGN
jgi:ribosomal protein L29